MALKPENPVVGGTVLRRQAIQSPDYVPGVSGWTINQDGSAEFNDLTIRGTFMGTDFVINTAGAFFYSPSEGAGNLVASIAPAAGTDTYGNIWLAGTASYGAGFATALTGGSVQYYLGSLPGGWTLEGELEINSIDGHLISNFTNTELTGNLTVDGTSISAPGVTAIDFDVAVIDVANGKVNLNMAQPPNYPTAGRTLAQTQACLDGLIGSMINRQLVA
jgi:hypothetical protein